MEDRTSSLPAEDRYSSLEVAHSLAVVVGSLLGRSSRGLRHRRDLHSMGPRLVDMFVVGIEGVCRPLRGFKDVKLQVDLSAVQRTYVFVAELR